ncbi:MAG: DUF2207 domain-containing protein [Candidatus Vogelbacteria bacterium]
MRKLLLLVVALLFIFPGLISAQVKSYSYQAINFNIRVNQDSTFDVTERQTFDYRGSFHVATRDIPLRLVGSVTNVEVIDGVTSLPLQFSAKRLDKLDPSSWGKYTRYRSGGTEHIEWYYNLADTTHEWIIKYQVHGGLSFYRDHDELYWNLFTDYQVPIGQVSAHVSLPPNQFSPAADYFKATAYASSIQVTGQAIDNQTFIFTASNLGPREKLTIAAGWPKGLVSEQGYWFDWLKINWAYLLALLIALGSFVYGLVFWLKHEKFNQGRGTIVAQYEPPEKLKPAMAEVIIKEKITDKAWSATIIDLAVRGYVSITEDKQSRIGKFASLFIGSLVPLLFFLFVFMFWSLPFIHTFNSSSIFVLLLFSSLFFLLPILLSISRWRSAVQHRDYRIEKTEKVPTDFEDYEKKFLELLFEDKNYFSTKEFRRRGNTVKQEFALALRDLKKELYKETEQDTKAYDVGPSKETRKTITWILLFGSAWLVVFIGGFLTAMGFQFQYFFLIWVVVVSTLTLRAFIKYETRLNKTGQILKEEWLGFKMYLETAEKYRLQNLTPDLFEKYLPYAIILGVEKKWGQAFARLSMTSPEWYHGTSVAGTGSFSAGASGFSASAFSASFSSSFASAFASSGATGGGASGGGGGAGGGGGGGGGGAS